MVDDKLVAKAKRLVTVMDSLREMSEGLEVAAGQLMFLEEQEMPHGVSEIEQCEADIRDDMWFLEQELAIRLRRLARDIADQDDHASWQLEQPAILRVADDILRSENGG